MISLTADLGKLRAFLSQAFLYDGTPAIENVVLEAKPEALYTKNLSLNIAGLYSVVSPKFFKVYEVEKPTPFVVTTSFFLRLSRLLKGSETVEVRVTDDSIEAVGSNESYKEDLLNIQAPAFPLVINEGEVLGSENAPLPKGAVEKASVVAKFKVADFLGLPSVEKLTMSSTDSNLRIDVRDVGLYSRTIKPLETVKLAPISIELSMEYFSRLTKNIITEDVWLLVNKDAIALSKMTPEVASLLLLSTQGE